MVVSFSPENRESSAARIIIASAVTKGTHPNVSVRAVNDPSILNRGRVYAEAINQTRPIAVPGPEATRIAEVICNGTARRNGICQSTAEKMVTAGRRLESLVAGANPCGKAAEVVTTSDYRALHAGHNVGIINPPEHVAHNVHDIRLAPDVASRKDLIFAFETKRGGVIWKYNGQVKTGGPQYVADTLVQMANTSKYGKVGYVDSRYVNSDGTPRIAPDAFTPGQARRLQEAKVRLRGIPDLEKRAAQLMADIKAGELDGLSPVARQELMQLRDDIVAAYRLRGVTGRIGGGAAIAAASAALVSLVVQLATEGRVDAKTIGKAAGTGAIGGAGGAVADAGFYHLGIRYLDMTPEVAKEFARQGVAVGFCMLAVGTDLTSEISAVRRGDVTVAGAVGGTAAKAALDLLPLVMAPLGLAGIPILVGTQVGGRWLIGKAREADRVLNEAITLDEALAESIRRRTTAFAETIKEVRSECADSDFIFREVMNYPPPLAHLSLLHSLISSQEI